MHYDLPMNKQERKGHHNLTGQRYVSPKTANHYIRMYYRNADSELLCADTPPMTLITARKFLKEWRKGIYAFEHVEVLECGKDDPPQCGARLVIFPSQLEVVDG